MNWSNRRELFKLTLIILWLVFTVAFALWWFRFSLENIAILTTLQPDHAEHWDRQRRMILSEGSSWIVLLGIGGISLIALVQKERWRVRRTKEFFASFSHEIKTSLASLRLQAEALKEDGSQSPILDRLIGDTVRLQLQLENSLFLSSQETLQLFIQPIDLGQTLDRMREQFPDLKLEMTKPCVVRADDRALRTIFSNLLQNARVHGSALQVNFAPASFGTKHVELIIRDNGRGFIGDRSRLGQLFHRPKPTSGSGLGLYICRLLVDRMSGKIGFQESASGGFEIRLLLEGALL